MCVVVTDKLCPLNCACPGVKCDTSEVKKKKKNSCFHSVLKMDTQATLYQISPRILRTSSWGGVKRSESTTDGNSGLDANKIWGWLFN